MIYSIFRPFFALMFSVQVTRRAAGFPGKDEKLIMLFKRPRKNGAPISERRRPPISSHGRNESISVAAPSVASTQQKPSASDGEDDDFVEDDDIIEIDDDDDDFGEVIKAQNTVPRVSGRGAREPVRRSTILDEDPIEIDDEQSQEAGPSRPVLNNEDKIEERCLKELLELRDIVGAASLSVSYHTDLACARSFVTMDLIMYLTCWMTILCIC